MEWLLVVIFYALSFFLKKRQQKAVNKEIESDPDWDPEKKSGSAKGLEFFEKFLQSQGVIDNSEVNERKDFFSGQEDSFEMSSVEENIEVDYESNYKNKENPIPEKTKFIKRKAPERRGENRRSTDRDDKGQKSIPTNYGKLKQELTSLNRLKRGIILKEILDKPLSLRKGR